MHPILVVFPSAQEVGQGKPFHVPRFAMCLWFSMVGLLASCFVVPQCDIGFAWQVEFHRTHQHFIRNLPCNPCGSQFGWPAEAKGESTSLGPGGSPSKKEPVVSAERAALFTLGKDLTICSMVYCCFGATKGEQPNQNVPQT